mmetsp:Transcript_11629/g.19223  ORF Transcript_11629/g.19223 Transcript_11629/m.19223 type:complete len:85 (+) Transcript_11629:116-370(+)
MHRTSAQDKISRKRKNTHMHTMSIDVRQKSGSIIGIEILTSSNTIHWSAGGSPPPVHLWSAAASAASHPAPPHALQSFGRHLVS